MSWIDQRPDDAMDGAFTVVGPDTVHTCDQAQFREAMSRLGAAVHVVTTAGPGGKTGATATAVCSVSDAPPTLLVCINRSSQTNPVVVENGVTRLVPLDPTAPCVVEDHARADLTYITVD